MEEGGYKYRGWLSVPDWRLSIALIPKNGTRSINHALRRHFLPDLAPGDERMRVSWWRLPCAQKMFGHIKESPGGIRRIRAMGFPLVAIARDPVERFMSLYRCQIVEHRPGLGRYHEHVRTPEALMRWIEKRPWDNPHWLPQALYLDEADEIIPLHQLGQWWSENVSGAPELQVENTTSGPSDVSDALRGRILAHYAADQRHWDNLEGR